MKKDRLRFYITAGVIIFLAWLFFFVVAGTVDVHLTSIGYRAETESGFMPLPTQFLVAHFYTQYGGYTSEAFTCLWLGFATWFAFAGPRQRHLTDLRMRFLFSFIVYTLLMLVLSAVLLSATVGGRIRWSYPMGTLETTVITVPLMVHVLPWARKIMIIVVVMASIRIVSKERRVSQQEHREPTHDSAP